MRPKLSKLSAEAMGVLSRKNPNDCDLFEKTVAGKITSLSMGIEQGNSQVSDLEDKLRDTKEALIKAMGEYSGWADALVGYYQSRAEQARGKPGIPIAAVGRVIPEAPEEASEEASEGVPEDLHPLD